MTEITNKLQCIQNQVPDILAMVTTIRNDSSDFAAFLQGLPSLPTLPVGLTVSQINVVTGSRRAYNSFRTQPMLMARKLICKVLLSPLSSPTCSGAPEPVITVRRMRNVLVGSLITFHVYFGKLSNSCYLVR